MARKLTTQEFVVKAKVVHGDKYDYSRTEYVKSSEKVVIACKKHGEFFQTPNKHLIGRGCQLCAGNKKETTDSFIAKAKTIHGDRYDYSLVNYEGNKMQVTIICSIHGEFKQTPSDHTNQRSGCQQCKFDKVASARTLTHEQFLQRATEAHNGKYDYSKTLYQRGCDEITVICPAHGEFVQNAQVHYKGHGCPKCRNDANAKLQQKTTPEFIQSAVAVHGDRYDYSLVEYLSVRQPVKIVCYEHGEFEQVASNHLSGNGCPKCFTRGWHSEDYFIENPGEAEKPCVLYYIKFTKGDASLYKIGIDSSGDRWRKTFRGWDITTLFSKDMPKLAAWREEQEILSKCEEYRYRVINAEFKGHGWTEMFTFDVLGVDNNG